MYFGKVGMVLVPVGMSSCGSEGVGGVDSCGFWMITSVLLWRVSWARVLSSLAGLRSIEVAVTQMQIMPVRKPVAK